MQVQVAGLDLQAPNNNPTTVLCLMNMVGEDELVDDEEYDGILFCLMAFLVLSCLMILITFIFSFWFYDLIVENLSFHLNTFYGNYD